MSGEQLASLVVDVDRLVAVHGDTIVFYSDPNVPGIAWVVEGDFCQTQTGAAGPDVDSFDTAAELVCELVRRGYRVQR